MRAFMLLIIGILCLAPLSAAKWIGYQTPLVVVYVRPGEERVAQDIAAMTHAEVARLAHSLGLTSIKPFPIYAYTNRTDFQRDAGPRPLLLGVSYRPSGMIRLDVTGSEGPVRQVLAHELTHTLLNFRLGLHVSRLPNWMNEGMAGYYATDVSRDQLPTLSRLWHQRGVLSLEGMESAFDDGQGVDAAYQQSLSMIAWLEYHHPGALRKIVDAMAQGSYFDDALRDTVNITPDEWLKEWQAGIPLYELLLNLMATPIVYAPMALIIILLATLHARRKRQEEEAARQEEESAADLTEILPYSIASRLVDMHLQHDLSQFPIWDDITTR